MGSKLRRARDPVDRQRFPVRLKAFAASKCGVRGTTEVFERLPPGDKWAGGKIQPNLVGNALSLREFQP